MLVRSNQAVTQPAVPASANQGSRGVTSRRQDRLPRRHQKTTSNAAMTVNVNCAIECLRRAASAGVSYN